MKIIPKNKACGTLKVGDLVGNSADPSKYSVVVAAGKDFFSVIGKSAVRIGSKEHMTVYKFQWEHYTDSIYIFTESEVIAECL